MLAKRTFFFVTIFVLASLALNCYFLIIIIILLLFSIFIFVSLVSQDLAVVIKVVMVCGGGGGAHLKFCSGDTVKVVVPFIEKSMKEEKETNYKENNKAHLKGG